MFGKKNLFGRNMDIDYSLDEEFIFLPKEYEIKFRYEVKIRSTYSIMGLGKKIDNNYFFFDAINECGLGVACLAFKDNCKYFKYSSKKKNIASFELVLYILSICKDIEEVKERIKNLNIIDEDYNDNIKNTPLHYFVCDKNKSIVIESTIEGINVYDNDFNVLTNNPTFTYHIENVKNYLYLSNGDQENNLIKDKKISSYSYNLGALGLPGDFSSSSRFIKCLYIKNNLKHL